MKTTIRIPLRKVLAATLAASIGLLPLANIAHAGIITIADAPPAAVNSVKPNIMYTLDNSGSMLWGSITGQDGTGEYAVSCSGSTCTYPNSRAYFSGDYNGVYYNPSITYTSAKDYLGNSFGPSTPTAAPLDPFPTTGKTPSTLDLTLTCFGKASSATDPVLPFYSRTGTYATAFPFATNTNCLAASTVLFPKQYARYAFYYVYTGAAGGLVGNNNPNNSLFTTRVDIIPSNAPFTGAGFAGRADCIAVPGQCNYTEEIQNFANWFSYYRTRIQMTKTSLGLVFSQLDIDPTLTPKFRVGFNTINGTSTNNTAVADGAYWYTIRDFASYTTALPFVASPASQKGQWFAKLYNIMPANSTPLRTQMDRIGKLYEGTLSGFDYAGNDPYRLSASDPTLASCRASYHIMSTDGFWNDSFSGVTNQDTTVPTLPSPVAGLTAGSNWPRPFYDASTTTVPTLADVALKYWATDLRPGLANNLFTNPADPADWQHMTTFTIGLGASGSLIYQPDYLTAATGDFASIKSGAKTWPAPTADQPTTIDDLWHAAVNGHGTYLSAKDPASLSTGLSKILNDINARTLASAGASLASPVITASSNVAYTVNYNSADWSGELTARTLDTTTGLPISGTPDWSARDKLNTKGAGTGWDSNRKIVTFNGTGVTFRRTSLSATQASALTSSLSAVQQALLGTPTMQQDAIVNYLRGDKSKEGALAAQLRQRQYLLGDIVDSEAVVVGKPDADYGDDFNPGYSTFKNTSTAASRETMIYVGANDGMLHAFDASGQERWAYVPSLLLRSGGTGLGALARQPTGVPPFSHQYYVNLTPWVQDVDFSRTNGATPLAGGDWHTMLIGGLGKGGKGYYALDITTPPAAGDAESAIATAKVLWEFTDTDMGYTFGQPNIVKTAKYGWVVLLPSGYDNQGGTGAGKGYLYVLNAKTGAVIKKLTTNVGTNASPSGLGHVTGFIQSSLDYTVDYVYGGDVEGNVFRFDLTDTNGSYPTTATLFTTVKNTAAATQPITTDVRVAIDPADNKTRWVFVGTGKYLDTSDNTVTSVQTMYAFKDGTKTKVVGTAAKPLLDSGLSLPVPSDRSTLVVASTTRVPNNKDGWYQDLLVNTGERINVRPVYNGGVIAWITSAPSTDPCAGVFTSNAYARIFGSGDSILVDNTSPLVVKPKVQYITNSKGFVSIQVVKIKGKVRIVATTTDAPTSGVPLTDICTSGCTGPGTGKAYRTSWREILE